MANIKLPPRFQKKIDNNQQYAGVVYEVLSTLGEILQDNKLYFFEEYTDHGIRHIENVIAASNHLIPSATFNTILTDVDVSSYLLAVILHDIAMHLSPEGLNAVIKGGFDDVRKTDLDKDTWAVLWENYLCEAKRFDDKQRKAIFGDTTVMIAEPPLENPEQLNGNHRKLIGEFIRRHHPRLAHEIALKGFPGKGAPIPFAKGLDEKQRDVIGLIARSHGMNIRKCSDYIEQAYGRTNKILTHGIHAVFLMVVLRIADYLQIDQHRTSKVLLKLRTLCSPVSEMEHAAHLAVESVNLEYTEDPERIIVQAFPKDSMMYLKLKGLLASIQAEFDISWAVLGELYGNSKKKPAIKYRRITSNLEEATFIHQQEYVADHFAFKANEHMMPLMMAPLYGDNPTYGVRELLHNAIDACNERTAIEIRNGHDTYIPAVKVEITKEGEEHYFTITDNGIGMPLTVIKDYFLTCGASLRTNPSWQMDFIDEKGDCTVTRNGRFGVGVLAAYLIGQDIEVSTRPIGAATGYRFTASLNAAQINVIKDANIAEGTIIRIKIKQEKLRFFDMSANSNPPYDLEWNEWYTLSTPRVDYYYLGDECDNESIHTPNLDEVVSVCWNELAAPGFSRVLWTYERFDIYYLTCNGFIVPLKTESDLEYDNESKDRGAFRTPSISIFDPNALLPLSLSRNSIAGEFPFSQALWEDICKDFLAYALMFTMMRVMTDEQVSFGIQQLRYPGFKPEGNINARRLNYILLTAKGWLINAVHTALKIGPLEVIEIASESILEEDIALELEKKVLISDMKKDERGRFFGNDRYKILEGVYETGEVCIYYHESKMQTFNRKEEAWRFGSKYFRFDKYGDTGWHCHRRRFQGTSIVTPGFLDKYGSELYFIREYTIPQDQMVSDPTLNAILEKYLGDDPVIPFALEDRKKKFPLAFKELARYMKKYEAKAIEAV